MVAVHLARQSLLSEETDMALAGAVSVRVPHRAGYFCNGNGVVSPDGHVRAFDANANGTVFGSGGGMLVLKRLADAIAAGDTIHAVIKGSAVNNDGSAKAGYTAPSVQGQAEVVLEALANAGVDAESIGYVEAHGSGTPLGDPIEVAALTKAFRALTKRSGFCAIGSVKSNVGHLDAAAAVTGIIKTVLALKHGVIPPTLNYTTPNPEIDFPSTPFYVNAETREWQSDGPRRAGVMSTGMGGTNAHIVLEEAPLMKTIADTPPHLLVLSAKTATALDRAAQNLAAFIEQDDALRLSDVEHTLESGRKEFMHRRFVVCNDRTDAIRSLAAPPKRGTTGEASDIRRPVVFLLPGVGDQYVGMGRGLYERWPVFAQAIDQCAEILEPLIGADIRTVLYPEGGTWKKSNQKSGIDLRRMLERTQADGSDPHSTRLNETRFAQPALFAIEYATCRLWQSLGVTPDAIGGHSMGEYVAATLAGVMSLEDALTLLARRAQLVSELPAGAMLAVTLPERDLAALLSDDMSIALINGPQLCVVAGPPDRIDAFEAEMNGRRIMTRRIRNAHAFHSRMLDPIVDAFEREVGKVRLSAPYNTYI
jgi:acyl transferase domain-containing protein